MGSLAGSISSTYFCRKWGGGQTETHTPSAEVAMSLQMARATQLAACEGQDTGLRSSRQGTL